MRPRSDRAEAADDIGLARHEAPDLLMAAESRGRRNPRRRNAPVGCTGSRDGLDFI
jgi:hypothetical protein